jgi:hypothetical protein
VLSKHAGFTFGLGNLAMTIYFMQTAYNLALPSDAIGRGAHRSPSCCFACTRAPAAPVVPAAPSSH